MGHNFSQFLMKFRSKSNSKITIGLLGLDNAGKTTILYYLKTNKHSDHIFPTMGFNVETIECGKHSLTIWDISGSQPRTKILWSHYNKKTKVIIFVIDTNDTQRLPLAKAELEAVWLQTDSNTLFLIYANKQDLPGGITCETLNKYLDLQSLSVRHPCLIQQCCALSGSGLWEGIQKLVQLHEERQKKNSLGRRKTI